MEAALGVRIISWKCNVIIELMGLCDARRGWYYYESFCVRTRGPYLTRGGSGRIRHPSE